MEYDFKKIEDKWKKIWEEKGIYKITEDPTKPKYYVLDMFPYPSGAGLHVGHPLGYVASDIYARYKRLKGFNVLHPMGYDAFGLPAEQYAIETGTHPAVTTEKAIKRYREQLDKIGFSFDWSRQVKTSDPAYYKWTQWMFLKLFGSWYNRAKNKAEPIETLIEKFELENTMFEVNGENMEWNDLTESDQQKILMQYRLAFLSYAEVNWCPALGTVLANDEVKDGKSERGGYPVERKKMRQWFLRITEYSDRLLEGLDKLDWSESMKEMQRNWIGRSEGARIEFHLSPTLSEGEGAKSPKYHTTDGQTWKHNLELAKEHRSAPTEAESIVWEYLRAKRTGYKFRRQHPVDRFIPDFVCLEKGLVVEIDGKIHLQQVEQDKERTEVLERHGFEVLRFTNEEIIANVLGVVEKIKAKLALKAERKVLPFGEDLGGVVLEIFTTRPDTIFGATFMVIAPEHELVEQLTNVEQKQEVEAYITYVKSRTDVERQQEKRVTGVFTGSYVVNPFTGKDIPIWIAEYVLAGYGTGAIMAVPADDERDRKFAEKFGLPIVDVIDKSMYHGATIEDKVGKMINSDFLNGLEVKDAIKKMLEEIESRGIGEKKINYRQRDAGFSRQRYWGEPFPIVLTPDPSLRERGPGGEDENIIVTPLPESELPLVLPEVSSYKPSGDGSSPLANNKEWVDKHYETDTMPGYAGSSWYFLRYMDAHNDKEFAAKDKIDYWQNVDVYFGGAEHAVGHLLYSRMWHKFLYDLGYVNTDEPFKKLVNQGMIQGVSQVLTCAEIRANEITGINSEGKKIFGDKKDLCFYGALNHDGSKFIHPGFKSLETWRDFTFEGKRYYVNATISMQAWRIPIWYVDNKNRISEENLKKLFGENKYLLPNFDFEKTVAWVYEENKRLIQLEPAVEKMSKRYSNVINPDDVVDQYGADCFRMFEMFLGPLEQSKPWDDKGISGVSNFLRKFWRLFYDDKGWKVTDEKASDAELKILHKTLKKIAEDIERLNFNTSVSAFMIATNELTTLGCHKKEILEPLLIALAPFAPFITDELWEKLGHSTSIHKDAYPTIEEKYLVEDSFNYPVSINGKVRAQVNLSLSLNAEDIEKEILQMEKIKQFTNGNPPKKFIFVKGKIINVVI